MRNNSAECLVDKRDGRCERMRATKLARSIGHALCGEGMAPEDGLEIAAAVLARVGASRRSRLGSCELADAVCEELIVAGFPAAAQRYHEVSEARHHRLCSALVSGLERRG